MKIQQFSKRINGPNGNKREFIDACRAFIREATKNAPANVHIVVNWGSGLDSGAAMLKLDGVQRLEIKTSPIAPIRGGRHDEVMFIIDGINYYNDMDSDEVAKLIGVEQ